MAFILSSRQQPGGVSDTRVNEVTPGPPVEGVQLTRSKSSNLLQCLNCLIQQKVLLLQELHR